MSILKYTTDGEGTTKNFLQIFSRLKMCESEVPGGGSLVKTNVRQGEGVCTKTNDDEQGEGGGLKLGNLGERTL